MAWLASLKAKWASVKLKKFNLKTQNLGKMKMDFIGSYFDSSKLLITCNRVFLHCCITTISMKDLNTSSTLWGWKWKQWIWKVSQDILTAYIRRCCGPWCWAWCRRHWNTQRFSLLKWDSDCLYINSSADKYQTTSCKKHQSTHFSFWWFSHGSVALLINCWSSGVSWQSTLWTALEDTVSTWRWQAVWMNFRQRHLLDIRCAASDLHADSVVDLQEIDSLHNSKAQHVVSYGWWRNWMANLLPKWDSGWEANSFDQP